MSKKNRKKHRVESFSAAPADKKPKPTEMPKKEGSDLKDDYIGLLKSISFIILLLIAIYYFDQKDHILNGITDKIFNSI